MLHTRRNFLQLGRVSAAALALSPGDYEAAANEIQRPVEKNGNKLRELVRLATLAPPATTRSPGNLR